MTELNLPTLLLYNRSQARQNIAEKTIRIDNHLYDVLKQSNRIQNMYHSPGLPYQSPSIYQAEERIIKNQIELDYLNNYYNTLRRQEVSLQSTQRAESLQSFGKIKQNKRTICDFDQPHHKIKCSQKIIMKSPYLNQQNPPIHIAEQDQQPAINPRINKQAYLRPKEQKQPQKTIQKPFQKPNQNNLPVKQQQNIMKRTVQESDRSFIDKLVSNQSKSMIIEQPSLKKQMISQQIQTQDPVANRSSFLIERVLKKVPQIMNQRNFENAIKNLDKQISNIKLNLDSDDMIIDLTDLVSSKDQYVEESRRLLTNLNVLSQGKINSQLIKTSKNSQGLVWPQGV